MRFILERQIGIFQWTLIFCLHHSILLCYLLQYLTSTDKLLYKLHIFFLHALHSVSLRFFSIPNFTHNDVSRIN